MNIIDYLLAFKPVYVNGKLVINSSFMFMHSFMYLCYWIHCHLGRPVNVWLFRIVSGHMDSVIFMNED